MKQKHAKKISDILNFIRTEHRVHSPERITSYTLVICE